MRYCAQCRPHVEHNLHCLRKQSPDLKHHRPMMVMSQNLLSYWQPRQSPRLEPFGSRNKATHNAVWGLCMTSAHKDAGTVLFQWILPRAGVMADSMWRMLASCGDVCWIHGFEAGRCRRLTLGSQAMTWARLYRHCQVARTCPCAAHRMPVGSLSCPHKLNGHVFLS